MIATAISLIIIKITSTGNIDVCAANTLPIKNTFSYNDDVPLGIKPYTMTSSNGNIFRVTGPLCGEFVGHW